LAPRGHRSAARLGGRAIRPGALAALSPSDVEGINRYWKVSSVAAESPRDSAFDSMFGCTNLTESVDYRSATKPPQLSRTQPTSPSPLGSVFLRFRSSECCLVGSCAGLLISRLLVRFQRRAPT